MYLVSAVLVTEYILKHFLLNVINFQNKCIETLETIVKVEAMNTAEW